MKSDQREDDVQEEVQASGQGRRTARAFYEMGVHPDPALSPEMQLGMTDRVMSSRKPGLDDYDEFGDY